MLAKTGGTKMGTLANELATDRDASHEQAGALARAWYFTRHLLEMCAAMCIGTGVLTPLFVWGAGQMGYSDPFLQLPEVSALVAAFAMTVPMAAWMRFRGMEWGPINEMSGVMVAEAILLIGAYWLGILPKSTLFVWQHALMMPIMLIPMFLRLDLYTRRACHTTRAA